MICECLLAVSYLRADQSEVILMPAEIRDLSMYYLPTYLFPFFKYDGIEIQNTPDRFESEYFHLVGKITINHDIFDRSS